MKETSGIKVAPSCEEEGSNLLRFTNPFIGDNYAGDELITIVFKNRILPGSNLMIKGIEIRTFASIEDVDYLIDDIELPDLNFFAPLQQLFLSSAISTGSEEVYSETFFSFSHTLANFVPKDAIMYITIPPQIEVKDPAEVVNSCTADKNLLVTLNCELALQADGYYLLTVTNVFPEDGLAR